MINMLRTLIRKLYNMEKQMRCEGIKRIGYILNKRAEWSILYMKLDKC
jgi:hypothetical protein